MNVQIKQKVSYKQSLQYKYPKLVREWHPTKNGELTPDYVTCGSNKKVWWICKKKHEWKTKIATRIRYKTGCPYCSGRYATAENNLAVVNPEIAKEWHPTKNGKLTPYNVKPNSGKKVWWICKKGHEWKTSVAQRHNGYGCVYCANQAVNEDNCFAKYHPELIKEWHPEKNVELTPYDVTPGSGKKVWWRCRKGHEWQAEVKSRSIGINCPYCSHRKVCKDNCLATINPGLAKEWHPEKNGKLTPYNVLPAISKKVWWICKKGHEWYATINSRSKRSNCPYCNGSLPTEETCLATVKPELIKQWHSEKNVGLTPYDVTSGSKKRIWWICQKEHEWKTSITNRTSGNGCPYCAGKKVCKDNCLATINPELAKEWHPEKNGDLNPKDVVANSHKKAWWKCAKGHEWEAQIKSRNKGNGCPYCSNRKVCEDNCLATLNPELAKEWHPEKNKGLTPKDVVPGCNKRVWWKCFYGHEWQAAINNRNRGTGNCPACRKELREWAYTKKESTGLKFRTR